MNFNLLLSALYARRRIFFWILVTTVLATALVSLIVPKTYVAKASVSVSGKNEQSMDADRRDDSDRAGYVQTQVDILTSSNVAHRVVSELKLANNPLATEHLDFDPAKGGTIEDAVAEHLLKDLKIEASTSTAADPGPNPSGIIQFSFASHDPRYSAMVANAFAKDYIDTVLDLRKEPTRRAASWFDQQAKELRGNLEQAEKRLADFQLEHGIVASDERYDVESAQLANLAGQLALLGSAGITRGGVGGGVPAGVMPSEALPEVLANHDIQALKADLSHAEAKLQEMGTEYGVNHPKYQAQEAEIQVLRQKVASAMQNAYGGVLQTEERIRHRKEKLMREIDAQRTRVLSFKQARNQLSMLSHDVENAQATYDMAMKRYIATKVEGGAMQTNVAVLDQAVPPVKAARPKFLLNVALAAIVGTLIGIGTVLLLEMADQRVRRLEDLTSDPQVPLLAVLNTWDPVADRLLAAPGSRRALPRPSA